MDQPVLTGLFVVEVEKLPEVPIAPSVDTVARHCSSMGAMKAVASRETLWTKMLSLYRGYPRTDADIAEILGIQRSTVNARRAELIEQGLVESERRWQKNPKTGVNNSLWGLTEKGRQG